VEAPGVGFTRPGRVNLRGRTTLTSTSGAETLARAAKGRNAGHTGSSISYPYPAIKPCVATTARNRPTKVSHLPRPTTAEQIGEDAEEHHQVSDEHEAPDDDLDDVPEILHDLSSISRVVAAGAVRCDGP